MSARPPVSVVIPFAGDAAHARELADALQGLRLTAGDELIVADNGGDGASVLAAAGARVVPAPLQRSSYYARNVGADAAANEWVLFIDSDCRPAADLLDAYFREPVGDRVGALAGDVLDARDQDALVARYTRSRRLLDADRGAEFAYKPAAVTANLLVRKAGWSAVGGFVEGIRSGGDSDFAWRLQEAGWTLERAPAAAVEHRHRETLRGLLSQKARYGSSRAWLSRRHPGSFPPLRAWLELPRALVAALRWLVLGQRERGAFRALDAVGGAAELYGSARSNAVAPAPPHGDGRRIAILSDRFPEVSETFIAQEALALERLGWSVRIEATNRALRPNRAAGRALPAAYVEDEPVVRRALDLLWLAARHPLGLLADLIARLRWRQQEPVLPLRALAPSAHRIARGDVVHLHAHFAAEAALTALRLHRLLGVPYSVTAHAYDIYLEVRNLEEKLREAAFATSGCDYTVRDLRTIAPQSADRIHKVIMGIDAGQLRRRTRHPDRGPIVSVGRLVEKKGFADLIAAAAILHERAAVDGVVIVGDGPLRGALEAQIAAAGLGGIVRLAGACQPEETLALIEQAAVFCLPCVVARNGDRDSMPVVVKEALALEVPVVVTDEVGLPELVRPGWGALVPPHDPPALAAALQAMLERPTAERAAMGKAGREFVLEHCNVDTETARLAALIEAAGSAPVASRTGFRVTH